MKHPKTLATVSVVATLLMSATVNADESRTLDALAVHLSNKRDWKKPEEGRFALSSFSFLDMNGNGEYDLEDKPLANIPIGLLDEDGEIIEIKHTNIDGYVNFYGSSRREQEHSIREPGTYTLRVFPPQQLKLTTDSLTQHIDVDYLEGSIGGLFAKTNPKISGFKRNLKISGPAVHAEEVAISSPSGEQYSVYKSDNRFETVVDKGKVNLKIGGLEKEITVSDVSIQLSDRALKTSDAMTSNVTVNFDDLISHKGVLRIPNGYHGLDWNNWVLTEKRFYAAEGYQNGNISGDYVAYNSSGHPASISRKDSFDFIGGYFSVSYGVAEGEGLEIKAYNGDELKYQDVVELSSYAPVYFKADYKGITKIEFKTNHYWQAIADNLEFGL